MSVLRFLSPSRRSTATSPGPSNSRRRRDDQQQPKLDLRLPSYGCVFMTPDNSHLPDMEGLRDIENGAGPSTRPRMDKEVRGELEVQLPVGMGRRRVKAIRVGWQTVVELSLSPDRLKEKDTIFERKTEIRGGNSEGIVLEEGIQRFDFTLIIPVNLCSHDRHENGEIQHSVFAELIGLESTSSSSTRDHSPYSTTPKSGRSNSPLRSRSPDCEPYGAANPASLASALSMAITRQDDHLPPVPPYEGQAAAVEWLDGTVRKERYSELLYNPHPDGGVTNLDVAIRNFVSGLGPFDLRLLSDCWTNGALLYATVSISDPSPALTLYCLRVQLVQTHSIISPRDDPATTKPTVVTKNFTLFTKGSRPMQPRPSDTAPALWKGRDAGGSDAAGVTLEATGRVPYDDQARPSSMPNIPTPITVTHKLVVELLHSVWGEDIKGDKLPGGGPGMVRALVIEKPTVVVSCNFTPEELRLPTYGSLAPEDVFSPLATTCSMCGKEPHEKLCLTCPPTSIPHPRHDHPPKLVNNPNGICPVCVVEVAPTGMATWDACACGMSTDYLLQRLKRSTNLTVNTERVEEDQDARGLAGGRAGRRLTQENKEE